MITYTQALRLYRKRFGCDEPDFYTFLVPPVTYYHFAEVMLAAVKRGRKLTNEEVSNAYQPDIDELELT